MSIKSGFHLIFCLILFVQHNMYGLSDTTSSDLNAVLTNPLDISDMDSSIIGTNNTSTPALNRKFNENFKDKYQSDDFDYEVKPRTKNALQRFFEWLFGPPRETKKSGNSGAILVWIARIAAFIIIIYAVFAIVSILLGKKGNWIFDKNDQKRVISFPLSEENLHEEDYNTLYDRSRKNGDFRMAIRYRYLILLHQLSTRGIIRYNKDKTNSDYYYEIKDKKLSAAFSYVSYIYEHIWYGGFELENHDFGVAEQAFDHTSSILRYE